MKENEKILSQFQAFCECNPLKFQEDELKRIEDDIYYSRNGIVSDEYVDFMMWTKGLKSRAESFSEYVQEVFPVDRFSKLLEVGCGRIPRVSMKLSEQGYHMTAIDPKLDKNVVAGNHVLCLDTKFNWEKTDITLYDAVIAQEPCEATEHIVRACVKYQKNFLIVLCGVPHALLSGENPENVWEWYNYLQDIGGKNCMLAKPKLIKGYVSYVLVGIF